jgi:hypothetical protein
MPGIPIGTARAAAVLLDSALRAKPRHRGVGQGRLLSQAFVLDHSVPDGFAATRAIESWIR